MLFLMPTKTRRVPAQCPRLPERAQHLAQGDDDYDIIGTDELVIGGIFKATRAAYRGLAKAKPGRAESFGFLLIALAL
jgi:hypothetical protein